MNLLRVCHTPRTETSLDLIELSVPGGGKCHLRIPYPQWSVLMRDLVSLCLNGGFRTVRVRNRVKNMVS